MDALTLLLFIPLAGGVTLGALGHRRVAQDLNALFSLATLVAAAALSARVMGEGPFEAYGEWFFVDALNVFLVTLTAFVGFTTALFSRPYMRVECDHGKMTPGRMRLYHSMYQLFTGMMLVALTTNNLGILWVAMEAATLTTVLLVSVYRTAASLEAAWKYFILCGVGIAQALFGTILIYLAAERSIGGGGEALLWTHLSAAKALLDPEVLSLAFVFLLVGYGTKVGLVPVHNWLPDAHAEGPTPISAVLSGLLLNVALYAVLRVKVLADGAVQNGLPGHMMVGFGLLTVLAAAFFLLRQRDVKRMFAYSSIEHMGIITFAFGLGGPFANFAGLLHMVMHSLTKSGIFFAVGHIAQVKRTQDITRISGLTVSHPLLGWGLVLGVVAIAGLPPLGIFMSEFLVVSSTVAREPLLAVPLVGGILVGFGALMLRLSGLAFGEPTGPSDPAKASYVPMYLHLALVFAAGFYLPPVLVSWFQHVAAQLG